MNRPITLDFPKNIPKRFIEPNALRRSGAAFSQEALNKQGYKVFRGRPGSPLRFSPEDYLASLRLQTHWRGYNVRCKLKSLVKKRLFQEYSHTPAFIDEEIANELLELLKKNIQWEKFQLSPNSRLVSRWQGSNSEHLNCLIEGFTVLIQQRFQTNVKGIFLNWYKDGNDYCPYHSDRYGTNVYTISLGGTRDLLIKQNGRGTRAEKFTLKSGDLYFMSNKMQSTHKHSIPKRKKVNSERMSVVFFTAK